MAEPAYIFRLSKKDEYRDELLHIIAELRGRAVFSRTMRDGIRLMWDLMMGRTDILLELFPHVRDSLCPPTDDKLRKDMDELKRMVSELGRAGQLGGSHNGLLMSTSQPPLTGLKKLGDMKTAPSLPAFDDDNDDLPTIVTIKGIGNEGANNFLKSLTGI